METLRLIIDDIPPSNNRFMGNSNTHFIYNSKKKEWRKIVQKSLPASLPSKPLSKVKVSIHYIFPDKRRRDLDNYSGKFLLDPLVEMGVLEDDNYAVLCNLNLSAECKPKIKKTVVQIEEVENVQR